MQQTEQDISFEENPWYNHVMVQYEITRQLQYKYLSIRKKLPNNKFSLVRYLLGYSPDLMKKSVSKYGGFQFGFKFYFDLAYWKEMPMFSFNSEKRKIERQDFDASWEKHFDGYDYAIDIDALDKNPLTAHYDAAIIKKLFDQNKIPYSLRFSGSKGFHFVIPYQYLPSRIKVLNLPSACYKTTEWIINRFALKNIDDSIYDHRRILKLAYTTDGNKVCLPLNDDQFNNFDIEKMKINYVLQNVKIFKRGLLLRTHGLSDTDLKKNVQKLFKGEVSYIEN